MDPKDKVALVTGGVSGIGFSIATELLKNGAKGVALLDINQETGEKALKTLEKEYGKKVIFIKCDVTNVDEFESAFKETITKFGNLSILVNCAGIGGINYIKQMHINLGGVMHGVMLGNKYLKKNINGSGGVIVNIASAIVFSDQAQYSIPNYSATKAGVITLSQSWGHTFHYNRTGVRIIALCPALVDTAMIKLNDHYNQAMLDEWNKLIDSYPLLKPESLGRSAIYVIEMADSGSVWMTSENKLWKMNYPDCKTMMELVVDKI